MAAEEPVSGELGNRVRRLERMEADLRVLSAGQIPVWNGSGWDPIPATAFGRGLLELANAAALRASAGIARGADSITGNGTASMAKTITHGLGATPAVVFVEPAGSLFNGGPSAIGATTFVANLRRLDGTNWATTQDFYWLAIL